MQIARAVFFGAWISAAIASAPAVAHDVRAIANPDLQKEPEVTEADIDAAFAQQPDANSKYVIERATLWTPGQTLRLCFFGGTAEERNRVQSQAEELFSQSAVNLKLVVQSDCQKAANGRYSSELRVSLQDSCCSAYVGRQSLVGSIASGPNIFLQGTGDSITIKHEFIHALGFHHEHQKPVSPCKFKYDVIAATYGWSRSTVITNFQRLAANSTKYIWDSGFDVESAMKYYFAPEFLEGGSASPCFYPQAAALSAGDIAGLQRAYPKGFDMAAHKSKLANKAVVAVPQGNPLKAVLAAFPNE